MSSFLKIFIGIAITFAGIANHVSYAQCVINTKTTNNVVNSETPEKYEYLRTGKKYYGLSIKTVMKKKPQEINYTIAVKYTGDKLSTQPVSLKFILTDGYTLTAKLKFIKSQKTDDSKTTTTIYEVALLSNDIIRLKQTPLKQVNMRWYKNTNEVSIPVDDETFIQNQLSCLESTALN
jgi:hypothetical protein